MKSSGGVGVLKGVLYEDAVFMRDEYLFLGKYHTSNAESYRGNTVAVKLAYVFMAIRAEHPFSILMKPQIEGGPMLNNSLVER